MVKRYLVTGGAGFIGSHLVEALLQEGHEVIVYDNLSTGDTQNLINLSTVGAVIKLAVADITDSDDVRNAMQGCDGVFHLAALPLVAQSIEEPVETHLANTHGTMIVLNEARQANIPVVFASSSSVYGHALNPGDDHGIEEIALLLSWRVKPIVSRLLWLTNYRSPSFAFSMSMVRANPQLARTQVRLPLFVTMLCMIAHRLYTATEHSRGISSMSKMWHKRLY